MHRDRIATPKAVGPSVPPHLSLLDSGDAVPGTNPERGSVVEKRRYGVIGETVALGDRRPLPVAETKDSTIVGANPQGSFPVACGARNDASLETIVWPERRDAAAGDRGQASTLRSHEHAATIIEDRPDHVGPKALALCVSRNGTSQQLIDAAEACGDPDAAIAVLEERADVVVAQAISRCKGIDLPVAEAYRAMTGAEPDSAVPVDEHRPNLAVTQHFG